MLIYLELNIFALCMENIKVYMKMKTVIKNWRYYNISYRYFKCLQKLNITLLMNSDAQARGMSEIRMFNYYLFCVG